MNFITFIKHLDPTKFSLSDMRILKWESSNGTANFYWNFLAKALTLSLVDILIAGPYFTTNLKVI